MRRLPGATLGALLALSAVITACSPAAPPPPPPPAIAAAAPSCAEGRADCDGDPKNGCEADLSSSTACGACGVSCGPLEACLSGACARTHTLHAGVGACAIREGRVHCWGPILATDESELPRARTRPHVMEGAEDALIVRFNPTYTTPACAATAAGKAVCWPETPEDLAKRTDVRDVAPYGNTVCAVTTKGQVICDGQRVKGITDAAAIVASDDLFTILRKDGRLTSLYSEQGEDVAPIDFPGVTTAIDVAASFHSTCVLLADGRVKCSDMAFGSGSYQPPAERPLLDVPGLTDAVAIDIGCAVRSNGQAVAWDGAGKPTRPLPGVEDARRIACGDRFGCYERRDGAVLCWGNRRSGRLGDGAETTRYSPVEVEGIEGATAVAVGQLGACALKKDGTVACWGTVHNDRRRGIPPERAPGIEGAISLTATSLNLCVVDGNKVVHCWPPSLPFDEIKKYSGLGDIRMASASLMAGAAIRASGEVVLFDAPYTGEPTKPPFVIPGVRDAIDVAFGADKFCVTRRSGKVSCVAPTPGFPPIARAPKWFDVPGIRDAVAANGTVTRMTVLRKTGDTANIEAFYDDHLAFVVKVDSSQLAGVPDLVRVSTSSSSVCGVTKGGQVFCRGGSGAVLQGAGDRDYTAAPRPVKDLRDAVDVSACETYACALRSNGKVVCWGEGDGDVTGGGDPPIRMTPVEVPLELTTSAAP